VSVTRHQPLSKLLHQAGIARTDPELGFYEVETAEVNSLPYLSCPGDQSGLPVTKHQERPLRNARRIGGNLSRVARWISRLARSSASIP